TIIFAKGSVQHLMAVDQRRCQPSSLSRIPEDGDMILAAGNGPGPIVAECGIEHPVTVCQWMMIRFASTSDPHLSFKRIDVAVPTRSNQALACRVPLNGTNGGVCRVKERRKPGEVMFQVEHVHLIRSSQRQQCAVRTKR